MEVINGSAVNLMRKKDTTKIGTAFSFYIWPFLAIYAFEIRPKLTQISFCIVTEYLNL